MNIQCFQVCKYGEFPEGHPDVITEGIKDVNTDRSYRGIIKVCSIYSTISSTVFTTHYSMYNLQYSQLTTVCTIHTICTISSAVHNYST